MLGSPGWLGERACDAELDVLRWLAGAQPEVPGGAEVDSRAGGRLESRYDEAAVELHGWSDGRLLHGDLEGGHILVADDQYRGIIDFD
jgi:Ser/Thr protein kinase RdoA (MazF antagonist)